MDRLAWDLALKLTHSAFMEMSEHCLAQEEKTFWSSCSGVENHNPQAMKSPLNSGRHQRPSLKTYSSQSPLGV